MSTPRSHTSSSSTEDDPSSFDVPSMGGPYISPTTCRSRGIGSWFKETVWPSSSSRSSPMKRSCSYQQENNDRMMMDQNDPSVVDQLQRELAEARQQIKILRDAEEDRRNHQQQQQQQQVWKDPTAATNVWTMKISLSSTDESSRDPRTACTDLEDEETYDQLSHLTVGDSPSEIWMTIPFENPIAGFDDETDDYGTAPHPPLLEITAIREAEESNDNNSSNNNDNDDTISIRLQNAEARAQAFRYKLGQAEDLVASLFRDLERAKQTVYTLAHKNVDCVARIHDIKLEMEDYMVHRSSFAKACIYISPFFILFGGMDVFLCTVIMVWIFVEIDSIVDIDAEEGGEEE